MFLVPGHFVATLLLNALVNKIELRRLSGPGMCQHLCQSLWGCSVYMFSSPHLICRVFEENQTGFSNDWTVRVLNPMHDTKNFAALNLTCGRYSRIFFNRAGRLSCATNSDAILENKQQQQLPRSLFLLIEHVSKQQQPVHQFYPHNSSMTLYPKLRLKCVKAVTYYTAINSLVLSGICPPSLSILSLDDYTVKRRKNDILSTSMIEDVKRHNLIVAIGYGDFRPAIYSTTDGETFKLLFNISQPLSDNHNYPSAMAMDQNGDSLYICLSKKIIMANFQFKTMTEIYQGPYLRGFDIDLSGDTLYFGTEEHVFRMTLKNANITKVASFKSLVMNIFYVRYHIYASIFGVEDLISVAIHEKTRTAAFHKLITREKHNYLMFCRLP